MADLLLGHRVRRRAKLGEIAVRASVHDENELVDCLEAQWRAVRCEHVDVFPVRVRVRIRVRVSGSGEEVREGWDVACTWKA